MLRYITMTQPELLPECEALPATEAPDRLPTLGERCVAAIRDNLAKTHRFWRDLKGDEVAAIIDAMPDAEKAANPPKSRVGRAKTAAGESSTSRNELFDALARACDCDPTQMTKRDARACGVALAEIRSAMPTVTPEDFAQRAAKYRSLYRGMALTPSSLCAHWAACGTIQQRVYAGRPSEPEGWREAAKVVAHATTNDDLRERRLEAAHENSWESIGGQFRTLILDQLANSTK